MRKDISNVIIFVHIYFFIFASKLLKIIEYGVQSSKKFNEMIKLLEKDGPLLKLPSLTARTISPDQTSIISFPNSSMLSTERGEKLLVKNTNKNSILFSLQNQ